MTITPLESLKAYLDGRMAAAESAADPLWGLGAVVIERAKDVTAEINAAVAKARKAALVLSSLRGEVEQAEDAGGPLVNTTYLATLFARPVVAALDEADVDTLRDQLLAEIHWFTAEVKKHIKSRVLRVRSWQTIPHDTFWISQIQFSYQVRLTPVHDLP